jgi:hypothetical protein
MPDSTENNRKIEKEVGNASSKKQRLQWYQTSKTVAMHSEQALRYRK